MKGSEELEYQYGLLQGITEGARWCGVDIGYLKLDDGLIHSVSITDHIKSYFIKEII